MPSLGATATPVEWSEAFIGLGANLGDGVSAMRTALAALAARSDTSVARVSSLYRSSPVGAAGPDYVNAVAELRTSLKPQHMLEVLLEIEHQAGRERPYRNAPRTLDLDVLLYGNQRVATTTLCIPHPRMYERAFVLLPLAEICPGCVSAMQLAAVAAQTIERSGEWVDNYVLDGTRTP